MDNLSKSLRLVDIKVYGNHKFYYLHKTQRQKHIPMDSPG